MQKHSDQIQNHAAPRHADMTSIIVRWDIECPPTRAHSAMAHSNEMWRTLWNASQIFLRSPSLSLWQQTDQLSLSHFFRFYFFAFTPTFRYFELLRLTTLYAQWFWNRWANVHASLCITMNCQFSCVRQCIRIIYANKIYWKYCGMLCKRRLSWKLVAWIAPLIVQFSSFSLAR